jgi:hypothetical protein
MRAVLTSSDKRIPSTFYEQRVPTWQLCWKTLCAMNLRCAKASKERFLMENIRREVNTKNTLLGHICDPVIDGIMTSTT